MALITCSNCGKMVSDKANACPHCGTPVKLVDSEPVQEETLQSQEPIHQAQPETESQPQPVSLPEPQVESTYDWHDEPKKGNGGLVAAIIIGVLALLAGAGWLWYDNSQKQAELERQLAIQLEQAQQDSIAAAELREQARLDSIAKAQKQEQINTIYSEYLKVLKQHQYGGYFLFDITRDGIPELWVSAHNQSELEDDWPGLHIFTITNNVSRKLCDAESGGSYYQGSDYVIVNWDWIGDDFRLMKITYQGDKISEKTIREYLWSENIQISEPKISLLDIEDSRSLMTSIKTYFDEQ